jgi:sialic acid synthase SpsE
MIVSTGMSSLAEVEAAVRTIDEAGNCNLVLLHCVSCYPADPAESNLRAMETLTAAFGVPVGYSDHTPGIAVALAAAARGACVIEKHFTLDRMLPGPDHRASLEPPEFAELVRGVRTVERALGDGRKRPAVSEADTAVAARRSLIVIEHVRAGATLTEELIAVLRPGTGLSPAFRPLIVGRTARVDIPAGTPLTLEMVS